jgi:ribose 5-phosphate isomerase A
MTTNLKRIAAERAVAEFIRDGQTVGLGTGSTAEFAIREIGSRVQQGLSVKGVATSALSERLARQLGIPLTDLNAVPKLDVTIDGADQIDEAFSMIKGGGGALTREKLVAQASDLEVIVVDESKLVPKLGVGFYVPVEVIPFAWKHTAGRLTAFGCKPTLRIIGTEPLVTDNGNYIIDCDFGAIQDCASLESGIRLVPGVVDSGLFVGLADVAVIGREGGTTEVRRLSPLSE